MEASRNESPEMNAFNSINYLLWQKAMTKRWDYDAYNRMLEDHYHHPSHPQQPQQQQQQRQINNNGQQSDAFFRPWEHPPQQNQQANIAVVRPFHSNHRVLPSRGENLHKKLLRGNHIQYQQYRYQYQQQKHHHHQINMDRVSANVNHAPESVILSRPLILETNTEATTNNNNNNNDIKMMPKTLSLPKSSRNNYLYNDYINKTNNNQQMVKHDLDPGLIDSENSNDLIICESNINKNEEASDEDSDDVEDIDCESVSSESSTSSQQPLDLRTTKIPYSSTAEYEISVIRSLSPVPNRITNGKEATRERKSRKLKTKRRICTACNRTYLKTKNLRWHFKSKLHLKRVSKLGIDDPANQPDTWYRTASDQHDNSNNFLENIIIRDESNI